MRPSRDVGPARTSVFAGLFLAKNLYLAWDLSHPCGGWVRRSVRLQRLNAAPLGVVPTRQGATADCGKA